MGYVAHKPRIARPREELQKTIPGWGADLDPATRPAVPKENLRAPGETGAHWDFPERQIEKWPREKSTEHKFLTPVFGTACPPKGLSGVIRKLAYKRYSEGQLTHWLLLVLADRIDVIESRITGLLQGKPDNMFSEMGLMAEFKGHGIKSRVGQHRADLIHLPVDVLMFGATTGAMLGGLFVLGRRVARMISPAPRRSTLGAWVAALSH